MDNYINLIKLSVGTETIDDLAAWQATKRAQTPNGLPRHVTRMWPKRADELLDGGSLYWVIKGNIQARQRITALNEAIGQDGIRRCAIVMDPKVIRVAPARRRPFQGWRYLAAEDAPPDLRAAVEGAGMGLETMASPAACRELCAGMVSCTHASMRACSVWGRRRRQNIRRIIGDEPGGNARPQGVGLRQAPLFTCNA